MHWAQLPEPSVGSGAADPESEIGGRRRQQGLYKQWVMESSIGDGLALTQQQQQPHASAADASLHRTLPRAMEVDSVGGTAASPNGPEDVGRRRSLERRVRFSAAEDVCKVRD